MDTWRRASSAALLVVEATGMDGGLLVYLVVKGAAYVFWCSVGLAVLDPSVPPSRARALRLGVLRLLLGLGFGVVIWFLGTTVFVTLHEIGGDAASFSVLAVVTYLLVYVPVRWIEWGIIELLVVREANPMITFVAGTDPQSRTWRTGGIVLSCLADVPLIVRSAACRSAASSASGRAAYGAVPGSGHCSPGGGFGWPMNKPVVS